MSPREEGDRLPVSWRRHAYEGLKEEGPAFHACMRTFTETLLHLGQEVGPFPEQGIDLRDQEATDG